MVANAIASSLAMARRKRSSAGGLPLAGQTAAQICARPTIGPSRPNLSSS